MRGSKARRHAVLCAASAVLALAGSAYHAGATDRPREKVLYNFAGLPDGRYPVSGLFFDSGVLFGTTSRGGAGDCPYAYPPGPVAAPPGLQLDGCGTVFALMPPATGETAWRETVLYNFTRSGVPNEFSPNPNGLIEGPSGALYGATTYGGAGARGTVFALSPPAPDGAWRAGVLASLTAQLGEYPNAGVVMDASGALYGTASAGGPKRGGAVFCLEPPAAGAGPWQASTLFGFGGADGRTPIAPLAIDASGVLYGTTFIGGADNFGEVFRLARAPGNASWTETTLFSFTGGTGAYPQAPVVIDKEGDLYGTTSAGGPGGAGTVFELDPSKRGWRETTLWGFRGADGAAPVAGLVIDAAGAVYGTTSRGGAYGKGTLFRLSPPLAGGNAWTLTSLHDFSGGDGETPAAPLTIGPSGAFYGTTLGGGVSGYGVVFKIEP